MKRLIAVMVILLSVGALAAPPTTKPTAKPAKPSAPEEAIERRIDDINFADMTLQQAIGAIAAKAGTTITVDWASLKGTDAEPTTKVRGRLMDVSVRAALQHLFTDVGATAPLTVRIDKDTVQITTIAAGLVSETRVYNVGPQLERIAAEMAATTPKGPPAGDLREAAADNLIHMISQHIAPESWRDAGGTAGSISITGARLSITNGRAALRDVEQYLKDLDKPRSK